MKKKSLIQKLPHNHFGTVGDKVINSLASGISCSVTGIPGYGMEFFAKFVANRLAQNPFKRKVCILNATDPQLVGAKYIKEVVYEALGITSMKPEGRYTVVVGEVLNAENKELYIFLSKLRWSLGDKLSILFVCNYTLIKDQESFIQYDSALFHPFYIIPVFDQEKTYNIISMNNTEFNWAIDNKYWPRIYMLSGGNPALIRNICMAMYEEGDQVLDSSKSLIMIEPLRTRIKDIVLAISELTIPDSLKLGIINSDLTPFSPLVSEYLHGNINQEISLLLNDLSDKEKVVISFMILKKGNYVTKELLAMILDQDLETYSEWAMYKFMQRLSLKAKRHFEIKNKRGVGWYLK